MKFKEGSSARKEYENTGRAILVVAAHMWMHNHDGSWDHHQTRCKYFLINITVPHPGEKHSTSSTKRYIELAHCVGTYQPLQ